MKLLFSQSSNRQQHLMMLKYLVFLCSIVVLVNSYGNSLKNENLSPRVAKSVLHLGQNVLKQVLLEKLGEKHTMEVVSPLSIAGAVSLVELGAIGQTYSELVQLMEQNDCKYKTLFIFKYMIIPRLHI